MCNYRPGLKLVCEILRAALSLTHTHTPVLYGILFPILMPSSHSIWRMKWSGKKIESISIKCHTNEWNTSNPNKQFQGNDIRTQLKLAFGFFFFSSSRDGTIAASIRFSFYLFVCLSRAWISDWMWLLVMMMMVIFLMLMRTVEQWNSECGCFQTIFAFISNSNSFQLNV